MPLAWAIGTPFKSSLITARILTMDNSLMNDRFGKGKGADRKKVTSAGIQRINHATGETVRIVRRSISRAV